MSNKVRIKEYDIAKGIGIILVVLGHILPRENTVNQFIYTFHMPLFFFISGLVMKIPEKGKPANLFKGEKRLFAYYAIFSVVFIAFDLVYRFLILRNVGVSFFVKCLYQTVTFYGIDVLWFLASLAFGKILTKLVWKAFRYKGIIALCAAVCVLVPMFLWNPNWTVVEGKTSSYLFYFPVNFIFRTVTVSGFVMLGTVLKTGIRTLVNKKLIIAGTVFLVLNVVIVLNRSLNTDYHGMRFDDRLLAPCLALSGIAGILGLSGIINLIPGIRAVFTRCSDSSVFIMVTHNYLQVIALSVWVVSLLKLPVTDPVGYALIFAVVTVIEIILCLSVEPFVNKAIAFIVAGHGKNKDSEKR